MSEDLTAVEPDEIQRRLSAVRERMRPVEQDLAALRGERDVLLTEVRRRERLAHRTSRADVKTAMKEGRFPTIAELVAAVDAGSLDDYAYNLKTGGELGSPGRPGVRVHFPGTRQERLAPAEEVYARSRPEDPPA